MSALKKRMAEKQHDRVEELKAAATPTRKRTPARVEAELAALTEVAEAVEVLPKATLQVVEEPTAPEPVTPKPVTAEVINTEVVPVGEEPWRKFVTPPAHPGTATYIRRVNIPISEATLAFLAARDFDLKTEKSRWVINRNELLASAARTYLANPDKWHAAYLAARADLPETPSTLQGRIPPELFDGLGMARFTPTGKRAVGPVMGFVVDQLLAGNTQPVR